MRSIEISGHISKACAMEYFAVAMKENAGFDGRVVCGYDVEFLPVPPHLAGGSVERLVRIVAPNQARTVVAVAIVGPGD